MYNVPTLRREECALAIVIANLLGTWALGFVFVMGKNRWVGGWKKVGNFFVG